MGLQVGEDGLLGGEDRLGLKLQIPLYMLVLRDLVGIEPLGGLYRALAGERDARGLLRASAKDDGIPGFQKNDYRDEDEFWARSTARPSTRAGSSTASVGATCATTRSATPAARPGATSRRSAG